MTGGMLNSVCILQIDESIHRLIDDIKEQSEAKYLLLKFCLKYIVLKNVMHLTFFLGDFILMLAKVLKLDSSNGLSAQGSGSQGPEP